MQHFEGFDPEGYSIYFVDYKYPEENTVNFIVMNKVPFSTVAWMLPTLAPRSVQTLFLLLSQALGSADSASSNCIHPLVLASLSHSCLV